MKRLSCFLFLIFLLVLAGCGGQGDSVNSTDGVPIAFQKTGTGPTALVLVHGWCCDQTYWRDQVAALSDSFTVVTLDLAGHGLSGQGRVDYTMESFGADVAAVVLALDLKQVYLVGHSMGGPVILEAAKLLPGRVKGLIGVDTLQEVGWNFTPEQVAGFLKPMQADFSGTTLRFVKSMFPAGADTTLVNSVAGKMAAARPAMALSAMKNLLLHDLRPTLAVLDSPIWCLDSNRTPVDFQAWKFYQPGYTAVLMQGVGHFLFMEKPGEFNEKLMDMVRRMEAG